MEPFEEKKLTEIQFKALHLLFEQIAKEMNDNGITMSAVLQKFILEVPATKQSVKEMWKILQKELTGKESTKELLKQQEIDMIWDALNKFFAQTFQMTLPPFPNREDLYYSQMK